MIGLSYGMVVMRMNEYVKARGKLRVPPAGESNESGKSPFPSSLLFLVTFLALKCEGLFFYFVLLSKERRSRYPLAREDFLRPQDLPMTTHKAQEG